MMISFTKMSLLFLNTENFNISKGERGSLLCNGIKGFSLILYYSTQCDHCHQVIPIFKQLPKYIQGCKFGMLNVSKNNKLVDMSKDTIAPLEYVPSIILYTNGTPFMRYEGNPDIESIKHFILDVQKNLKHKEEFSKVAPPIPLKKNIPAFSLGNPLSGSGKKNRCYLGYEKAYKK